MVEAKRLAMTITTVKFSVAQSGKISGVPPFKNDHFLQPKMDRRFSAFEFWTVSRRFFKFDFFAIFPCMTRVYAICILHKTRETFANRKKRFKISLMKQMSDISGYKQPIDLLKAQRLLRAKYGYDAPSYPTLRRWSDDGKLVLAERSIGQGQRRTMYSLAALERICLVIGRAKKLVLDSPDQPLAAGRNVGEGGAPAHAKAQSSSSPQVPGDIQSQLELLFDSVTALLSKVGEQDTVLKNCVNTMTRLDSIRTMLMVKYDATAETQRELIEQLRANSKLRDQNSEFERVALRIGVQLGQLSEKISGLSSSR
ncbi:hypothetical protein Rfer_4288 (plasmid) [Rhodoferax ferrireducens T118]|uniref:Uncharacterized protein n=1 Tax=Albidiferax ferrireducens (strain ATCC BAA-621 / DSM 15236 / T118) TaxID=338969 RepID=Q21QH0_ALBFT|nr:hypothetical protein [Rhodoferax ferrireducens]ABD71975.1 hypothetical protein Rfer_4288 [Rhodoferax ferrireducens T118]